MPVPIRLVDRSPQLPVQALIAALAPPPLSRDVRLETYRPDPVEPSQAAAVAALREFASALATPASRTGLLRRPDRSGSRGVYLDGGFGVGTARYADLRVMPIWSINPLQDRVIDPARSA